MSIVYNFCGVHETPTTALRVVGKFSEAGDMSVIVNGTKFTGDTISLSVRDGIGRTDVTGLKPDTLYDIAICLDGKTVKRTKGKTLPTDHCRIAFASCLANAAYQQWAIYCQRLGDVDLLHFAGDWNYEDNTSVARNQVAVPEGITNCLNIDARYQRIENEFILEEVQALFDTGVQFSYMWDDHEIFNSWQFDPNEADMQKLRHPGVITSAPTLDQLYDVWKVFDPFRKAIHYGNPASPNITGDIPSGAVSATDADAADFDPIFYSFEIPGLMTFYVLDHESHGSPDADSDNGSQDPIVKTAIGAAQRNWLLTNGAADENPFKFVLTGKYFWGLGNEASINADRWIRFPSETAAIANDIRDNWSNCTILLAGDVHLPSVHAQDGLYSFCMCPCGIGLIKRDAPYGDQTERVFPRANPRGWDHFMYLGVIDVTPETCEVAFHDVYRGRKYLPYRFTPSSNERMTPGKRVAA